MKMKPFDQRILDHLEYHHPIGSSDLVFQADDKLCEVYINRSVVGWLKNNYIIPIPKRFENGKLSSFTNKDWGRFAKLATFAIIYNNYDKLVQLGFPTDNRIATDEIVSMLLKWFVTYCCDVNYWLMKDVVDTSIYYGNGKKKTIRVWNKDYHECACILINDLKSICDSTIQDWIDGNERPQTIRGNHFRINKEYWEKIYGFYDEQMNYAINGQVKKAYTNMVLKKHYDPNLNMDEMMEKLESNGITLSGRTIVDWAKEWCQPKLKSKNDAKNDDRVKKVREYIQSNGSVKGITKIFDNTEKQWWKRNKDEVLKKVHFWKHL